ncbi:single-stranded-DNA-specific exonuclease RecJ [Alicyclobacillus cycloheptanicus]|uniref:Single-stranded-DNA-specific exonuclease RecJ n=1 Tax=Alicyclobacillus cycloheptanicus TaxID=1457 RepID=A0ABT9XEK4_9BACL|nr:single-stranded-DNA-specific exonuclease RecJ [Alicyclobacillus cycloheptanicus]MDQ0188726.1 single-stranded-DNA-specific exonuclease [Alicyclobacillus cycloheptanicus]WDM00609.1 single-stranded-DNA-specific exonuclease RecJ [Alicyclobacillus cycloheptanicus]
MNPQNEWSQTNQECRVSESWTQPPWRTAAVDPARAARLAQTLNIPLRVARWLCTRTEDDTEAAGWLAGADADTVLPWDWFADMAKAAERIWQAVIARETICIIGDYDVDGVTASAILATTLDIVGAEWHCLIPHRVDDGYGLSAALVDRAHALGASLVVTVDNGIRAVDAIDYAQELGVDVVITDHHEPPDTLPQSACAVVHWARASHREEVARLSGAGVARKLVDALYAKAPSHGYSGIVPQLHEAAVWQDGLAALGALADVMPMRGENRRLVRHGLDALRRTGQPGWIALCEAARVSPRGLSASTVLWNITPRLNAAGRMGSADTAFALLMAKSAGEASALADRIEALNLERRQATDEAARAAFQLCDAAQAEEAGGVVIAGPWPLGVVGIVAAKLCERYGRPAIVLADDGSGLLRGSGRAPAGFPLHDAVAVCADHVDHFGGHEAAIGCAVAREKLAAFQTAFAQAAQRMVRKQDRDAAAQVLADDYLSLVDATTETLDWLEKLGPFGPENPPLCFYIGPVEVVQVRPMGQKQEHLRIQVREAGVLADLVWFRADAAAFAWQPGTRIAAVVDLEENVWQGVRRAQLRVRSAQAMPGILGREAFARMYQMLRARRKIQLRDLEAARAVPLDELQVIFEAFVELGFARRLESAYHMIDNVDTRDLRESPSYQQHLARAWWGKVGAIE